MNKLIKKNADFNIMVSIIPVLMIMSMHKFLTLFGVLFCLIYFSYINFYALKNKSNIIPKIIIILLVLQNVGIGIGAHITGNSSSTLSLVSQIPSMFIIIASIFVLLKRDFVKTDILFGLYLIMLIVFVFIGDGIWGVKAVYLRNFTIFYPAYIIGAFYLKDKAVRDEFISFVLKLAVCAGIFGIIGMIIGKPFYQLIGVNEVYIAKKSASFVNGLPGNFITLFGSKWVNRMASFYYEPVNFSYFMSFAVISAAASQKWKSFTFLFICEILTFGKGGLLVMMASAVCIAVHLILKGLFPKLTLKNIKNIILIGMTGGVVLVAIIFYFFLTDIFGGYLHFYGIITGVEAILKWPLGHGLGSAGNIVRNFEGYGTFDISETGLVNMGYQIGLLGILIFIVFLIILSWKAFKNYSESNSDKGYLGILYIYMPVILMLVFIFQENTFTPQCVVSYMLIQGSFVHEFSSEPKIRITKNITVILEKINRKKSNKLGKYFDSYRK